MSDWPRIVPPPAFVEEIVRHFGAEGLAWLATLPDRAAEVAAGWRLTAAGPLRHGAHALVIPVTRGDDRFALKFAHPDEMLAQELAGLRAWNGHGAVLIVDELPEGIVLMEWLDADRDLTALPIDDAVREAGMLTRRLAVSPPPGTPFPTTNERANAIAESLRPRWASTGSPLSRRLLDFATAHAQSLDLASHGGDMSRRTMTTWDLHAENVLWGERAGWTMIDPMPLIGVPDVALAPFLWTRVEEIGGSAHLVTLVETYVSAGHLDMDLTLRWLVVRLVDYWLWGLGVGLTIDPERCRTLLIWLADAGYCPRP